MAGSDQQVRVTRRIEAAPETVWQVITDVEHAVEHLSQVTAVQLITAGPYAVGTGWRETRRMLGASDTQEQWVVENDPLRRTVLEAVDSSTSTRYRTTITLAPLEEGGATELTLTFMGDSPDANRMQRVAMLVVGPVGAKLTERALRTELDDIAKVAEAVEAAR